MLLFAEEEESDDGNMSLLLLLLMSTAPPEVMTGSCFHWSPNAEGYSDLGRFFGSFPPPPSTPEANQQQRWYFDQVDVSANWITLKIATPVNKLPI